MENNESKKNAFWMKFENEKEKKNNLRIEIN